MTSATRSVPQGKEPTVQVFIRHWKYEEPKLFILRTGNEAAGLRTPTHRRSIARVRGAAQG